MDSDQNLYQVLRQAIRRHAELDDAQIIEAGRYGADAGWPGFTYTRDCAEFYQTNKTNIWNLLNETADDLGEPVLKMIAGFNRADMAYSDDGFENLLAWFALEEVGRWLEASNENSE